MFKNDRMMMILTGLVLAIFAGSMVQYGDRIMALMSGGDAVATQDDSYSVRAGSSQTLDVLSNDKVKGPIVVLSRPSCGSVELTGNNRLTYSSDSDCTGEIEFAYCVDSDGECSPNAVRINVISVAFAQDNSRRPAEETRPAPAPPGTSTATVPAGSVATASESAPGTTTATSAPAPEVEAPEIATFTVEMAPPSLAAPSVTELVSPSVAVASIRQSGGRLNSANNTDQNIATQNSANIGQTASAGPTGFAAPGMGESSNISLGGSERTIAANVATPGSLQAASGGGNNITQLERGPEALASLPTVQNAPAAPESAPLSANPERSSFAPVAVASAQTDSPAPDARFSATPVDGGPVALIALNRTPNRGAADGESLNVILSEPGPQGFASPSELPEALAPASARPSAVSVLERAPNVQEQLVGPAALSAGAGLNIAISQLANSGVARSPLQKPEPPAAGAGYSAVGALVVASQPNQVAAPNGLRPPDEMQRFVALGIGAEPARRAGFIAALATPSGQAPARPAINLAPAATPPVLQASLPATPEAPVITAPTQNSACDVSLSARVRSGAIIQLDISAPCKPAQMVTISHSGLSFSVLTDAQGAASVQLPAMQADAEITARFQDQSTGSTRISVPDVENVVRAGVSWQADMNLDLTAIEFGAAVGTEGYITPQTPRDYRTSRIKGGGYLLQLGDPSIERGALAEVYTMPLGRTQQRGTIALNIMLEDATPVCGQAITAKTVRTREGRSAGVRNLRFTVPDCGTVAGQITLPGAVDDIRLAGR